MVFKKTANALILAIIVFVGIWFFLGLEFSEQIDVSFISFLGFVSLFLLALFELS